MEENDPKLQKHGFAHSHDLEESGEDSEPTTFKRELVHEMFSREMMESGVEGEPLDIGSSKYEKGPYSSNLFPIGSLGATSRGVIVVRGHNFDYVQILQRG